jgi:hypothetical protein
MDEYTVAMTVVLTSKRTDDNVQGQLQHNRQVAQIQQACRAVQDYVGLWAMAHKDAYDGGVEHNIMQVDRKGATADDVVPAKIVITG